MLSSQVMLCYIGKSHAACKAGKGHAYVYAKSRGAGKARACSACKNGSAMSMMFAWRGRQSRRAGMAQHDRQRRGEVGRGLGRR